MSSPSAAPLSGALPLTEWGLLHAQGADAAKFLHGQLTQDVEHLKAGEARLAGYCSAKGRLLASVVLWRADDGGYWLACSADVREALLKRLRMFVMRAQCQIDDGAPAHRPWGLVGQAALDGLGAAMPAAAWSTSVHEGAMVVRLPDVDGLPRLLWVRPSDAAEPALPRLADEVWRWLEVRSGVVRIVAATAEQFVPQMVNLELVGGVSFTKGCYPGQEVVARSQYRGTLKRRLLLLAGDAALSAGQEVFHSADPGQPAGLVALAAAAPGGGYLAQVELKLAAIAADAGGSLHAGSADGPLLTPAALPYALPQDSGAG